MLSDGRTPKQGSFTQSCASRRRYSCLPRLIVAPIMILLLLNFTGATVSECYAARSIVEGPEEIHERAWRQAAESAVTGSGFQKCAIYSSRSLAVANPEVYLQADEAWMKMMYDYSGWGANMELVEQGSGPCSRRRGSVPGVHLWTNPRTHNPRTIRGLI